MLRDRLSDKTVECVVFDDFVKNTHIHHGIDIVATPKTVKNVNFRLHHNTLFVSYPKRLPIKRLIEIIASRLNWAKSRQQAPPQNDQPPTLWGQVLDVNGYFAQHKLHSLSHCPTMTDEQLVGIYRHELSEKLNELRQKWQPIVGQSVHEIRLKRMKTRWGTCNTRDRRVWLSLYLAAYPYECTEYVFVHELCHLIHANHSKDFWRCVKQAMPDYEYWHNLLKRGGLPCVP